MANSTAGKVWTVTEAGVLSTTPVKTISIKFKAAANGDTFTLQTNPPGKTRKTVITGVIRDLDAEGEEKSFDMGGEWFHGLYVSAITSGATLEIITG